MLPNPLEQWECQSAPLSSQSRTSVAGFVTRRRFSERYQVCWNIGKFLSWPWSLFLIQWKDESAFGTLGFAAYRKMYQLFWNNEIVESSRFSRRCQLTKKIWLGWVILRALLRALNVLELLEQWDCGITSSSPRAPPPRKVTARISAFKNPTLLHIALCRVCSGTLKWRDSSTSSPKCQLTKGIFPGVNYGKGISWLLTIYQCFW